MRKTLKKERGAAKSVDIQSTLSWPLHMADSTPHVTAHHTCQFTSRRRGHTGTVLIQIEWDHRCTDLQCNHRLFTLVVSLVPLTLSSCWEKCNPLSTRLVSLLTLTPISPLQSASKSGPCHGSLLARGGWGGVEINMAKTTNHSANKWSRPTAWLSLALHK